MLGIVALKTKDATIVGRIGGGIYSLCTSYRVLFLFKTYGIELHGRFYSSCSINIIVKMLVN